MSLMTQSYLLEKYGPRLSVDQLAEVLWFKPQTVYGPAPSSFRRWQNPSKSSTDSLEISTEPKLSSRVQKRKPPTSITS